MIAQTPWIERTFRFDFPVGLFPVIFSRLEGSLFRLQRLLLDADDVFCSNRTTGWSVKEHVGHLYDMEELWWKRLQDFRDRKAVLSAADMANAKTESAFHNRKSLDQLLQQFIAERQRMLETIYGFNMHDLEQVSQHPRLGQPMRLVDSLFFVAEHDDHHITRVSTILRKTG
ncbi:MAG TPA: DinB family protein [Flavisolibacter sp.]